MHYIDFLARLGFAATPADIKSAWAKSLRQACAEHRFRAMGVRWVMKDTPQEAVWVVVGAHAAELGQRLSRRQGRDAQRRMFRNGLGWAMVGHEHGLGTLYALFDDEAGLSRLEEAYDTLEAHLVRSCATLAMCRRDHDIAEAFDGLRFAAGIIDRDRRMYVANRPMRELAAEKEGHVLVKAATFDFRDDFVRRRFWLMMKDFFETTRRRPARIVVAGLGIDLSPLSVRNRAVLGIRVLSQLGTVHEPRHVQSILGLTARETDLVLAIVQGETATNYAKRTQLSISTVRFYLREIFRKVGCRDQRELVKFVSVGAL